jgi:diketogulonate reductase-like aldo/keto reductase
MSAYVSALMLQVSLNYVRAKGIVPLPGVTSRAHALEIAGCLGWRLNGEEVSFENFSFNSSVHLLQHYNYSSAVFNTISELVYVCMHMCISSSSH